ncbi:MAG: hypothetical protein GX100_07615 [candidate division WS1 bacterium]|nr:hypothetical protein [candidate division WS1 bacterium]
MVRIPGTGILALALAVALPASVTAAPATDYASALVPALGAYLGAYIQLDPVAKGDLKAFEDLTGRRHAVYLRYVGYGEPFPYRWVQEVVARGALPQIAWEPNNGLNEVHDDAYLRGWAEAAAHSGTPILLRYASEMNGDWMPYSGNPDEYIRKWKLVTTVMREVAPNVIMIWCPFGLPRSTIPLYYPGDDFVDWVGINIYAVVYNNGDPGQPATESQFDQLKFVYDLYADRKPIAICEYAATHYCVAAKQQVREFAVRSMKELYAALPTRFPRVVLISWFSVNAASDRLANNEYAVTTDPLVLATYRELIASPYFLSAPVRRPPTAPGVPPDTAEDPPVIAPPIAAPPAPDQLVVPEHPFPLEGQAVPGPREMGVSLYGASPRAAAGKVTLAATLGSELKVDTVTFYLDGRIHCITNFKPYTWNWKIQEEPGEHVIKVVATAPNGVEVATAEVSVIVADSS